MGAKLSGRVSGARGRSSDQGGVSATGGPQWCGTPGSTLRARRRTAHLISET